MPADGGDDEAELQNPDFDGAHGKDEAEAERREVDRSYAHGVGGVNKGVGGVNKSGQMRHTHV